MPQIDYLTRDTSFEAGSINVVVSKRGSVKIRGWPLLTSS